MCAQAVIQIFITALFKKQNNINSQKLDALAQATEHLSSKHEALAQTP
jgi:hypothetical protein